MEHDRRHDLNAEDAGGASMQHDRKHNLNAAAAAGPSSDDHSGERDASLSARSLAARGDAPDASEDGPSDAREQPDGTPGT